MSAAGRLRRIGGAALLAAALAGAAFLAGCGKAPAAESADDASVTMQPLALRQAAAQDNRHGRTIMWALSDERDASVEIRRAGERETRAVQASSRFLPGSQGEPGRYVYTAELTDLAPGADYEYRTRAGKEAGAWHPLRTDDGGAFTALIFPDTQSADYGVWQNVAEAGRREAPDASFFIVMGDLVDNGQDESQWQRWLRAAEGLYETMPAAPVMGNHEAYSLDWQTALPERYLAHFTLPDNGVDGYRGYFYSFDWGPVHFTVLNTQMSELETWHPDLLEKEKAWLAADLAGTKQPWKVVLMHKDPLQYRIASRPERQEGFSPEGEAFMPLFDEAGVDAVLSAHLHTYRDRGHIYDFRRDPKGPLYILTGVAGDVRYPNLWTDHALDVTVAPQPETDNFMTLTADASSLTFRAFLPDGTRIDEVTLTR